MINKDRKLFATKILEKTGLKNLKYLGQGFEGIVFHDKKWVYKVIVPFFEKGNKWLTYRHLLFFFDKNKYKSFYHLEEVIETKEGVLIEKYQYEKSEPVINFSEDECIHFLTECWQKKIIIQDCKKENFIRVNGIIKLIDMDACEYYNDNLFLNTCARMYLYIHEKDNPNLKKIQRSAINNFDLPELANLREFVNKVFANIIYEESKPAFSSLKFEKKEDIVYDIYSTEKLPNLEKLFFLKIKENLYLSDIQISDITLSPYNTFITNKIYVGYKKIKKCKDKVSLVIKTCAMDVETIEENIKHIIKQLSFPKSFHEIIVSIDCKKDNFIRQYTNNHNYKNIIKIINRLQKEKIIDCFIIFNPDDATSINKKWFSLETDQTHSALGVPIASQLYTFEKCSGDYIFQMDSDVMIGRLDFSHDYLEDMISEMKKNEKVVSVGFNIFNSDSKPYFGFEDGGFVPEVRLGLFNKKRLMKLRPFPNSLNKEKKLNLTWYRSLEQHQKNTGFCSIRGGNNQSFFIHPQNYRKTNIHTWMNILDRIEQVKIPDCQYNNFDCEGSFFDWCIPKRNEKMVIISCFRNVQPDRFLRFWYSILNQEFKDFGIIIYDNCSNNGISILIEKLIRSLKDKITYIRGRNILPKIQCEYLIINNYCNNPESIIVSIDADDALIGKTVLYDIYKKYEMWGVDMTCGRVHQTYRIQPHYRYPVNFINPRKTGGNVWQHLKTFKKYLFDSIPLSYFMYNDEKNKISQRKWFEKCDDFAIMIPIVEMSSSPYHMDFINYYYERDYEKRDADRELKDKCIKEIIEKQSLTKAGIIKGRKSFSANTDKIEIDITFKCNLKCNGCNRSCGLAPSDEEMSIDDINNFIADSIHNNKKWKMINILGGEPTLHSNFLQIITILQKKYADIFNKNVTIQIVSNGLTEKTKELCKQAEKLKNVIIDYESFKTKNSIDYFTPFSDAPCDDNKFNEADYSKACWVTAYCGIGLNKNGYYACSVCGGIDRVLKTSNGVKSFTELTEDKQKEHFEKFCRLCGNFKHYSSNKGDFILRCEKMPFKNIISPTWKKIYKEYNSDK